MSPFSKTSRGSGLASGLPLPTPDVWTKSYDVGCHYSRKSSLFKLLNQPTSLTLPHYMLSILHKYEVVVACEATSPHHVLCGSGRSVLPCLS